MPPRIFSKLDKISEERAVDLCDREKPMLDTAITSELADMRDHEIFKASMRSLKAAEESALSAKRSHRIAVWLFVVAVVALFISILGIALKLWCT